MVDTLTIESGRRFVQRAQIDTLILNLKGSVADTIRSIGVGGTASLSGTFGLTPNGPDEQVSQFSVIKAIEPNLDGSINVVLARAADTAAHAN